MKTIFIILFAIPLFCTSIAFSQQTYTVYIPGINHYISYNPNNQGYGSGSDILYAGRNSNTIFRSYIYWPNIRSYVPSGSHVTQVKFYITWQGQGAQTAQIEFHDFSFGVGTPETYQNIGTGTLWGTKSATETEYSFTQLTAKIQAAVNGGSNDVWIGIKNQNESSVNYFVDYVYYYVNLEVTYQGSEVIVTQVDESGTPFGQVGIWSNNIWNYTNVPFTLNLQTGATVVLQSDTNYKAGTYQKYWKWTQNSTEYITNHHKFNVLTGSNMLRSTFKSANQGVVIKNKLEGTGIDGGLVNFKDPWLIDYPDPLYGNTKRNRGMDAPFKQRPSPFYPDYTTSYNGDVYKGVFLNQGITPQGQWQPPYYSVKADAVQDIYLSHTGKMHKFYFQNWSASPQGSADFQNVNSLETPVVFKQEGAVVSANYKGSLLSNDVNAISNTSQRKVIRTSNGHLHLFYVSMGKIWYEKSVNNGGTFYTPKKIENLVEGLSISSFSVDYVGNKIYLIAQIKDDSDNSSILRIYEIDENANVRYFPDENNSLIEIEDKAVNATPLVGANYGNILFIWKNRKSEPLKLIRFRWTGSNWEKSNVINIPNTTGNSVNPSLSLVKSETCSKVYTHLVWEERRGLKNSELYYCRIAMIRDQVNNNLFENFSNVTNGSGYEVSTNPVIVETGENTALIGFVGKRRFETENITPTEVKAVLTTIPFNGIFYSFGDDVESVSLNRCNTRWTFAWARGNDLPIQYTDSRDIRMVYQLGNLRGVDVYVTNGVVPEDMIAFAINTSIAPYPINYRAIYGEYIPEEIVITEDSREGVVSKEGADFQLNKIGKRFVGQGKAKPSENTPNPQ